MRTINLLAAAMLLSTAANLAHAQSAIFDPALATAMLLSTTENFAFAQSAIPAVPGSGHRIPEAARTSQQPPAADPGDRNRIAVPTTTQAGESR